jgi:hypothetical protein
MAAKVAPLISSSYAAASNAAAASLPWQPSASEEHNALDDALKRRNAADTIGWSQGSEAKPQQSDDKVPTSAAPALDNSELSGLGDAFSAFGAPSSAAANQNSSPVSAHVDTQSAASAIKDATLLKNPFDDPFDDFGATAAKPSSVSVPHQFQNVLPATQGAAAGSQSPTSLPWQPSPQEEHSALDTAMQRRQIAETMKLGPVPLPDGHDATAVPVTISAHVVSDNGATTSASSGSLSMDDDFDDDPFKAAHEAAQRMANPGEPQSKPRLRKPQPQLPAWATSESTNVPAQLDTKVENVQPAGPSGLRGASQRLAASAPAPAPGSGADMVEYYRNQLEGGSDW